jgi:WD40 repeat protein
MPTLTCFPFSTSKVVSLHFARHGRVLYTAGMDGIICELNSRTGESKDTIKATKKPINSFTLSHGERNFNFICSPDACLKKPLLKSSLPDVYYVNRRFLPKMDGLFLMYHEVENSFLIIC